jgi:replicative DNA helicase
MIERQKIDLSEERRILSHMITNTEFLHNLKNIATPKLFQSTFSKIIAEWIWEYFEFTDQAPGKAIQEIYHKKKKDIRNDDDIEIVTEFLTNLSKDWEKSEIHNVPYTTKNAIEFFKLRSLERLKNRLNDSIENNDSANGERLISEYKKLERPKGRGIDLLNDTQSIINAFSREHEFLFTYPGDLGKYLAPFMRGDFFAIIGEEKKGKSHYLWYTAYRALLMGLKVAFISCEMSEEQMLRRMWTGMVGQPLERQEVNMPYFKENEKGEYDIEFRKKLYDGINPTEIKQRQDFYKTHIRTGEMKLVIYPMDSATVQDIETELINWEYYENFIPDVLVIDYADILRPENTRLENRHQLNSIWKSMRGLAQDRNIVVVTGSQVNAEGKVAEDRRKLGHVTNMIKLVQNDREYEDGIMNIETVVRREGRTLKNKIVVLQSYEIGRPYLDSKIRRDVNMNKYEETKKKGVSMKS